jgi:hypothetical protein
MSEHQNKNVRDEFADAAAVNAIGAGTVHDSVTAEAPASADEVKLERELREVAARMSAASPYMEPSRDLKARIMAETAPANFKMSDYKKVNSDARWWRYGLIAATLFLVAAAYYNINLRNQLQELQTARAIDLRNQQALIEKIVSLDVQQVPIARNKEDGSKEIIGKLLVNSKTKEMFVVLPNVSIPPGETRNLPLEFQGQTFNIALRGGKQDANAYPGSTEGNLPKVSDQPAVAGKGFMP